MRQMVITRHGEPEVLQLRDAPDPEPGAGEVRIRVRAAGVNFSDILARIGLYPDAPSPPCVVGYEVCGVIDAVGAGVTTRREGDRVMALTHFGGYSEAVIVPEQFTFVAPAALSDAQAAGAPLREKAVREQRDRQNCEPHRPHPHKSGESPRGAAVMAAVTRP